MDSLGGRFRRNNTLYSKREKYSNFITNPHRLLKLTNKKQDEFNEPMMTTRKRHFNKDCYITSKKDTNDEAKEEPMSHQEQKRVWNSSYSIKIHPSPNPDGFIPTKAAQLRLICWKVKPWGAARLRSHLFSSQFAVQWKVDCDEVYPRLFIGDKASVFNLRFLKKIKVTAVLNTAEGDDEGLVNLSQDYFKDTGITYLGLPLWDCPNCNIFPYLGKASDFIESSLKSGGKCLVNCQMGVSRSSSCALSYLMIKQGMNASDALTQFRKHRDVRPNDGFLDILSDLDNELRKEREFGMCKKFELSNLMTVDLPKSNHFEFWVDPYDEEVEGPLLHLDGSSTTPNKQKRSSKCQTSVLNTRITSRKGSMENIPAISTDLEKVKNIIEKPENKWRYKSSNFKDSILVENETTSRQLRIICWRIRPKDRSDNLYSSIFDKSVTVDCDEVIPGVYIGDEASGKNINFLKSRGITHILNSSEGVWSNEAFVDVTKDYYSESGMIYTGFELMDCPKVNVSRYFGPANEFINNALKSGGKVLIFCKMGFSTSCVCTMSYMMLSLGMTASETILALRTRRDVRPNDHFLSKLADLDNQIKRQKNSLDALTFPLYKLNQVQDFPKPYHFEYWDTIPDLEQLPFTLRSQQTDLQISLELTSMAQKSESEGSTSWEYYTDSEE